ncbi:DUF4350 domain-containing protein [Lentibacillus sp. CBA3610]|uniref:DUF4350 domain-containing protein n=1 Tax=Lentibacillus sp. CBA3610 TaxID=2518176 RepID=UPI001595E62E|nr:DUF4350 domain-containing protein [Lentibacillus sp. CBA3610]QKY69270.1 DUF4350 domain-containing protein [Lentibacillus sp. CBA3610]
MQTSLTGRRALVWLVVVLLLFIGISYILAPDTPEEYPDFVSESPSPTGVKAFYTYLDNEQGSVERWTHAPELLSDQNDNQLLIMAGPSFTPDTEQMEAYMSFLGSGNTILLMKTNPDGMFNIETTPVQGVTGSVTTSNGDTYQAELNSMVRIDSNNHDNVLLHDNAGAIAVERRFENGRLITTVAPEWITNGNILEQDHLELILSLIEPANTGWDTVYFDEYVHGSGNAPGIAALYPNWLLALGLQTILFAVIWLWYQGKRFGPIHEPREETVRFSDERIQALAAWYQGSRRYADSLSIQADYVKLLMQERWGIRYHKDWSDVKEDLERKVSSDWEIETFINGLTHVLNQKRLSKKTYVSWSKKIDQLRKEVEEG